ncbi:MAG: arabinosidase, partial [Acidobacteria bacterium]|nr:arabinosidase [Acidobacteriota bacterium]
WAAVTAPFSQSWVEGPSVLEVKGAWLVYFDHYRKPQHYGAYLTKDWKSFEDVSKKLSFPADHRHGTVVRISAKEARSLKALR